MAEEVNAILGSAETVNLNDYLGDDVLSQIREEVLGGEEINVNQEQVQVEEINVGFGQGKNAGVSNVEN